MVDVEQKVKEIIIEKLRVEESQVTPAASLVNDLGADSLDVVDLLMAFEGAFTTPTFKMEIPDTDAEKIATVGDIVKYINGKLPA